jgi:predicted peroxiredoxin
LPVTGDSGAAGQETVTKESISAKDFTARRARNALRTSPEESFVTSYLLIESRDPFGSTAFRRRCELAAALRTGGSDVTLFLVENAALGARAAVRLPALEKLAKLGVQLLADEFALRERGIGGGEIMPGVRSAGPEMLVQLLASGARATWN